MLATAAIFAIASACSVLAWPAGADDPLHPWTIYGGSPGQGMNATFIGYGARLTSLYTPDRHGNYQDVVVGYDDPAQYIIDSETNHTFFGAVVGRYANRIKNGTFEIDGKNYSIPENENGGRDTLHGGLVGYDQRNWTVLQYNYSSVTFQFFDTAFEGFPGSVMNIATYSLNRNRLTTRLVSIPIDMDTPIMLANHIYWNLGAFVSGPSATILNDTLYMPHSKRIIEIDSLEVPTGGLQSVLYPWQDPPVPLNFTSPKLIGDGALHSQQCGFGCTGIDNAFILDRPPYSGKDSYDEPMLTWSSPDTGISLTVQTNQQSVQLYSCVGQNGTIPVKGTQEHGNGQNTFVNKYGCLVIETQQWIDGINQPEWGQYDQQVYGVDTMPAVNLAMYTFGAG